MKNMKRLQNFSRARFRAWLESLPGGTIIGTRGSPCNCPLATYLKDAPNGPHFAGPVVNGIYVGNEDKTGELQVAIDTPKWVKEFIDKIDIAMLGDSTVTVKEAIATLKRV